MAIPWEWQQVQSEKPPNVLLMILLTYDDSVMKPRELDVEPLILQ
jgi:hypothetical protein